MKCYDTELSEGAKNDVGVRVMYLFNLARATANEQRVEDHAWVTSEKTIVRFGLISSFCCRACLKRSRNSLRFDCLATR